MLCEITIENVAVIEKATATFDKGFTVLTGETGAGKSILIDSINAILGNRTSRDIVRSGAAKARIWARFTNLSAKVLAKLEEAGYEAEDELLLYREVSAEGKSSCRINGLPATAGMLREVCGGLIDIHGQHDNQSLLDPTKHLSVLDLYAHNDALLATYHGQYEQLTALRGQMRALQMDESEKARKLDLLRYEVEEIDAAALEAGEEDELLARRSVIRNAQQILEALGAAYAALNGSDDDELPSAVSLLGEAANQTSSAAVFDTALGEYAETLHEIYYTAGEIATDIQNRLDSFEYDGASLDEVELRLDTIYRLKQKYGPTVEAILEYGDDAREQLQNIEFAAERLEALEAQYEKVAAVATQTAMALRESRLAAFDRLTKDISGALDFLNMPGIVMALEATETPLGPDGMDEMEFYISTNPGEAPKPLAKIASGGELSRIMLALKSALAEKDEVPTVIYDEIDTGISGMASGRIGKLLQDTSTGRQVICVTHTAQVAAYAANHLLIQKQVEAGRTYTHIRTLTLREREQELARIMGGDAVTETTLASAAEMLARAGNA